MTLRTILIGFTVTALGCSQKTGKPPADEAPAPEAPAPRIGAVMVETAHRFELAGRARVAERWELSAYQVGEIAELFDVDMSRSLLPGACNDDVSEAMFARLLDEQLPALKEAADRRDAALFNERFRLASVSCNSCHAACEVDFVEVPDTPGQPIPRVSPVGIQIEATPANAAPTVE